MKLFRPLLLGIILLSLTLVLCGFSCLIAVVNPFLFVIALVGGMLGILMVMDFIDSVWLHKW
ncbi:MAG: hypothetical protein HC934_11415 [Acaryochloridaceae cyanobacterium SU_2_1]|nr:hypothetical protein [Acaryochloridaceae cyanobacterium SU_2_1]